MLTLEVIKAVLDNYFGFPFLPKGMVRTKWLPDAQAEGARRLGISIGRRDVVVTEHGRVTDSGTCLCSSLEEDAEAAEAAKGRTAGSGEQRE